MQTIIATIVVLAAAGWVARNGVRLMMSATRGAANGDQGGCGSCGGCSAKRKKLDPATNAVPLVSISGKVSRLHSDN